MNKQPPSLQLTPSNISKMSQSLAEAFALHPEHCQLLLTIYNVSSIDQLIEQWITENLLHPDDELAQILLPELTTRFHQHLEQIRRKEWLL